MISRVLGHRLNKQVIVHTSKREEDANTSPGVRGINVGHPGQTWIIKGLQEDMNKFWDKGCKNTVE